MVERLSWSLEALDDIEDIARHISRDSTYYANRVVQAIFELAETFPEHPKIGRKVPELDQEHIRERLLYSYRILYRTKDHELEIIAIIEGHRLLKNIEERFTDGGS